MNKYTRCAIYTLGQVVLAFGLMLNTKVGLGVSPLVSVSYVVSQLTGAAFADMTFASYAVFVLIEIALHALRKEPKWVFFDDVLQIPLTLVFTRFMNLLDRLLPNFASDCAGTIWGQLWMRFVLLALAIVLIGVGACSVLHTRLVPNPGDGVVQTISDFSGKPLGLVKNLFDICNVALAALISLIFRQSVIGVGVGTLLAMLGVGRVISATNRRFFSRSVR